MKVVLANISAVKAKLQKGTATLSATGASADIKAAIASTL
jgi:hypothetical protein